jgi:uronate dehydrogenase
MLPDSLTSHVVTTAALLDAMVEHGVGRIVYGGSNHAVGHLPRSGLPDGLLTTDVQPRPDTFYGVGKVAAEGLLSLYADRHGIDAVSCRIGSFLAEPQSARNLATWLSHDDCVRMVDAALTTPAPGFAVLYGISRNTRGWWDLAPGRALGYEPLDDAEDWADRIEPGPDDEAENARVGGPYAMAAMVRPALDRWS